ncbi:hypothetical protein Q3O97_05430 [Ralstonia pseudosolanacearum]|uniref:hypothetical protein n=1 Tax=Ralstonia pseudosolanacearum TaxID=1310165 RepID=UPI0014384F20|nr:hypothetical protein [Ralstonia pseudosolanacearum]MDO3615281.1 hypothetical protein [Ralstonia pseudosolanacearum]NKF95646.1 hypothetical protein [Ralstonia solanacearum]
MATNARKAVRPAVLAMQKKSMEVILRHADNARTQESPRRKPATLVLRTKLRVAVKGATLAIK